MDHSQYAVELFKEGYNCAQAVVVAFCDVTGLETNFAARVASSFGGGLGRLREVCGAVSGMALVAGQLYGYDSPTDSTSKKEHYTRIQEMAGQFRERSGSIICREILKNAPSDPNPTPRTEEFYKLRPCERMVFQAAQILDDYIAAHPL